MAGSDKAYKFLIPTIIIIAGVFLIVSKKNESRVVNPSHDYAQKYLVLVRDQDPKIALTSLRTEMATDNNLAKHCHSVTHQIGREAFKKYSDFAKALQYNDLICTDGYFHGVIEARLLDSKNIEEDIKHLCDDYPEGNPLSWQCFHGIGHGVMFYSANDLPRSLDFCSAYTSLFSLNECYQGVYMENFNADENIHPSQYVDPKDPSYPCTEQNGELRKSICYNMVPLYYLSLHPGEYGRALEWCATQEGYEKHCASGVGSVYVRDNLNSPSGVEKECNRSDNLASFCIAGAAALLINQNGTLSQVIDFCAKVEDRHKASCNAAIDLNRSNFSLQPE
ncbi:MAG TPA: hypothetical protein VD998_00855 [Verrucomicrobiae bacterium]|nr:hypothetical protein [Verrucomicrobiae bacterium]